MRRCLVAVLVAFLAPSVLAQATPEPEAWNPTPLLAGIVVTLVAIALGVLMLKLFRAPVLRFSEVKINFLLGASILGIIVLTAPLVGFPASDNVLSGYVGGIIARFGDLFGTGNKTEGQQ